MRARTYVGVWVGVLAALIVTLLLFRSILLPFVAGMAAAYFLDPVADKLERNGMSRTFATTIITIAFLIVVALVLVFLVPLLQQQVVELLTNLPSYFNAIRGWIEPMLQQWASEIEPGRVDKAESIVEKFSERAAQFVLEIVGDLWAGGMALVNLVALLFITPVVTFYLIRDWDILVARVNSWLPKEHAPVIREQARLMDSSLSGFIRGTGIVCLTLAVFYGAALSVAGLQFGLVIGIGFGIISFVPYVGSIGGLIVSVALAFIQFDEPWRIAVIAAIFIVGQLAEGMFLTPKLVGDRVRLHPVWVIFAVLAGGTLFGFVGMMIALPAAAMIGILIRFGIQQYLDSHMFHGDGTPALADSPEPAAIDTGDKTPEGTDPPA